MLPLTSRCHHHRCLRAAATMLPPSRCAPPPLPPPPLPPPPPRRRQATADVALLRCRHRRSLRAAATMLPPSRCAPPPRFALPPPLLGANLVIHHGVSQTLPFFRCRKSPKSPKFFLCIDNALRTVSVFESLVRLGDRESHRQNQASQLTVSALDNERTGVINNKQKTLTLVCLNLCEVP